MSSAIVSVRFPKTLYEKLEAYAIKHDFIDVSECIRTILRKKRLLESPESKSVLEALEMIKKELLRDKE